MESELLWDMYTQNIQRSVHEMIKKLLETEATNRRNVLWLGENC